MGIEARIKSVFQKVLDVNPDEMKPDQAFGASLGVDSTEMVEINVGLKKEFGIDLANNEVKKTHTINDVAALLSSKGVAQ